MRARQPFRLPLQHWQESGTVEVKSGTDAGQRWVELLADGRRVAFMSGAEAERVAEALAEHAEGGR